MRNTAVSLLSRTEAFNAAEEASIFARLKMRNGTFKKTSPSRFNDLEAIIAPFVARLPRHAEVLDIGVSTGITAIELLSYLKANGVTADLTATDVFIDAHIVKLAPGISVLCDPEGWPLEYDVRGMAVRPWTRRLDYLTLAFIPLKLARRALQPRLKAIVASGKATRVQMTTRRVPPGASIRFVENDVTSHTPRFDGRFDFARAANILNNGYFQPEQIRTALRNIRGYLRGPGSLLLITRTNGKLENDGTLFRLSEDGRFDPVARVGRGSEVESLVVGL